MSSSRVLLAVLLCIIHVSGSTLHDDARDSSDDSDESSAAAGALASDRRGVLAARGLQAGGESLAVGRRAEGDGDPASLVTKLVDAPMRTSRLK